MKLTTHCTHWFWTPLLGLSFLTWAAQAEPVLRREVIQAAQSAQEALKGKQGKEALAMLAPARALPDLQPDEKMLLERLAASAALQSQDNAAAIAAMESLVGMPTLPAAERKPFTESLVSVSVKAKDYARVERWAQACLQVGCAPDRMRLTLVQAMALQGHHPEVVATMKSWMATDGANASFSEEQWRVLGASQLALKDTPAYVETLTRLVESYPSKDYWGDLLLRLPAQAGFNPRLELDVYRLLLDTGNIEEATEYTDMAKLALKAGLPAEASRVLAQAQAAGLAKDASNDKLLQQARKRAQEDEQAMPQLIKSTQDSNGWAQLGLLYFSNAQWTQANAAFAQAFSLGSPKYVDEVRLHQGISLHQSGQSQTARQTLQQVGGDAHLLARLWIARLK